MSNLQFILGLTKDLEIRKCVAVPAGDSLDVPAIENGEPVPDAPGFIRQVEAVLVTNGAFNVTAEPLGEVTYSAGELMSAARYPDAHVIASAQDGSGYICIRPRDGAFWERQLIHLGPGESEVLSDGVAFVATGSVEAGGVYDAGTAIRLDDGWTAITAQTASYIVHLWKAP